MLKLNKKGQGAFDIARKTIFWMFMGVTITIMVLTFAYFVQSYQGKLTEVPGELKGEAITARFLESPDCFAYVDEFSGKVFSGVLDLDKLNEEQMDKCYFTGTYDLPNFRMYFPELNLTLNTDEYYNKIDFEQQKQVMVRNGTDVFPTSLIIYGQADFRVRDTNV